MIWRNHWTKTLKVMVALEVMWAMWVVKIMWMWIIRCHKWRSWSWRLQQMKKEFVCMKSKLKSPRSHSFPSILLKAPLKNHPVVNLILLLNLQTLIRKLRSIWPHNLLPVTTPTMTLYDFQKWNWIAKELVSVN